MTRFPLSDHFDGDRFFNPALTPPPQQPPAARGAVPMLRWLLTGPPSRWQGGIVDPAPVGDPRAATPAGSAGVTFIGHASFHLQLGGLSILTDPVFSDRCSPVGWAGPKRARPPGRLLEALPTVDVVLVSHNHYDHLDLPSLRQIVARDDPFFITPLGNADLLAQAGTKRVVELDWWQAHTLPDGTVVTATPARHFSARTPFDRRRALWSGFMLDPPDGTRVLFAGDSGAGPHWAAIHDQLGAPGLALLPIGAYAPRTLMAAVHMNPPEAVAAHIALGATRSVGMHFGTFQLTDEPISEPESMLKQAVAAAGLSPDAFVTLGFGETRVFDVRPPAD